MTQAHRAQSRAMADEGRHIRERRERLGLGIGELAERAKVDRGTLTKIEREGTGQARSLARLESALVALEDEAGISAPPAGDGLVEYEVSGDFGVRVVVRGPIADADALESSVARIIEKIRTREGEN